MFFTVLFLLQDPSFSYFSISACILSSIENWFLTSAWFGTGRPIFYTTKFCGDVFSSLASSDWLISYMNPAKRSHKQR